NEYEVFNTLEVQLNAAAERDGCVEMTVPMLYLQGIAPENGQAHPLGAENTVLALLLRKWFSAILFCGSNILRHDGGCSSEMATSGLGQTEKNSIRAVAVS